MGDEKKETDLENQDVYFNQEQTNTSRNKSISNDGRTLMSLELGSMGDEKKETDLENQDVYFNREQTNISRNKSISNDGLNKILPGWEYLSNRYNEEESLKEIQEAMRLNENIEIDLGEFGETILHYALLMKKKEAAEWLITNYPQLREKVYRGKRKVKETNMLYKGEGCLHIIVANRDLKMADHLLDSYHKDEKKESTLCDEYPLNEQRATGEFFQGLRDQTVYLGETALDFAVSTNQKKMVNLLMGYTQDNIFNGK